MKDTHDPCMWTISANPPAFTCKVYVQPQHIFLVLDGWRVEVLERLCFYCYLRSFF